MAVREKHWLKFTKFPDVSRKASGAFETQLRETASPWLDAGYERPLSSTSCRRRSTANQFEATGIVVFYA